MSGSGGGAGPLAVLPSSLKNRLVVGAVAAVLAVVALYVILGIIVHILEALILPAVVVIAIIYFGYRYLRSRIS